MQHTRISELYVRFKAETATQLPENQFSTFVIFFPALLVVMADGEIDDDEWFYVENLAEFMARAHYEDSPNEDLRGSHTQVFLKEIEKIIPLLNHWESPFLDTLAAVLFDNPEYKEDIVELLEVFADSSEGTSDTEKERIEFIANRLELDLE